MEQLAIEGLADATYRRASFHSETPVSPMQLALRVWNDREVVQVVERDALRFTPAALARVDGRRRILIRQGCAPQHFRFHVAHEFAHGIFDDEGIRFASEIEEEHACDSLAGALVAPRKAFLLAARAIGKDARQMALHFGTTESLCILRLGEVTGRGVGLVRPGLVRTRGDAEMPPITKLEAWARGHAPKGWEKSVRVDGERQRTALLRAA